MNMKSTENSNHSLFLPINVLTARCFLYVIQMVLDTFKYLFGI